MRLFSNAMMNRAKRACAREEFFEWANLSPEEKEEYRLQQIDMKKRRRLWMYVTISVLLLGLSIYSILNMNYYSQENVINLSILIISAIVSSVITAIRMIKYKRGEFNVK